MLALTRVGVRYPHVACMSPLSLSLLSVCLETHSLRRVRAVLHTAHTCTLKLVPYTHRYFPVHLKHCDAAAGGRWRGCDVSVLFLEEVASPPAAPYRCCITYAGPECPDIGPFAAVECAGKGGVFGASPGDRWGLAGRAMDTTTVYVGLLALCLQVRAGRPNDTRLLGAPGTGTVLSRVWL